MPSHRSVWSGTSWEVSLLVWVAGIMAAILEDTMGAISEGIMAAIVDTMDVDFTIAINCFVFCFLVKSLLYILFNKILLNLKMAYLLELLHYRLPTR
jgi:hypothetical protein